MNKDKKRKTVILLLTTIFLVIIIVAVFVMAQARENGKKALAIYAPQETVLYTEFKLSDENLEKYLNRRVGFEKVIKKFFLDNGFPLVLWEARQKIEKVALVKYPNPKGGYEELWLIRSTNGVRELETLSIKNYYLAVINKNTAVMSLSVKAVDKVRSLRPARGTVNSVLGNNNSLTHGYVDNEYLDKFLGSRVDNYIFLKKYVGLEKNSVTRWQADLKNSELHLNIDVPLAGYPKLKTFKEKGNKKLVGLNNVVVFNEFAPSLLMEILKLELEGKDKNNWQYLKSYMKEKYKVDLESLYTFIEQPSILVIQPKNTITQWEDLFSLSNYYYTILLGKTNQADEEGFIKSLELFIQNYLAFKYPSTKKIVLPDKTEGMELVADASSFKLENVKGEKNLKAVSKNGFEFNYLNRENMIALTNHVELLEKISSAYDRSMQEEDSEFDASIDFKIIDSKWTPWLKVGLFKAQTKGSALNIESRIELE